MNAALRLTPYSLAFPHRDDAERIFSAIVAECAARGVDVTEPSHFLQLGEVGLALQTMQGGDRGSEAVQGLGALLFQLFHFRRGGEFVLTLARDEAKGLVVDEGIGGELPSKVSLPSAAGYLQLPRHLFWSALDGGITSAEALPTEEAGDGDMLSNTSGTAEAIDGIFWTSSAGGTLSLAMISGILEGRPGFTIFELPPVPLSDLHLWPGLRARDGGADFASTLPGGELGGLHSIVVLGEVLKLLSRAFWLHDRGVEGGAITEAEDR